MPSDPQRIQQLFLAVTELPSSERVVYLERECADDLETRRRVEALLAAHEAADSFLVRPAVDVAQTLDSVAGPAPAPGNDAFAPTIDRSSIRGSTAASAAVRMLFLSGDVIGGRYTLEQKIGEGGMGEVWAARQTEPVKRRVALKLIKSGMDSRAVLTRFEQERQALALMDHPNIARVLDGGVTPTGQPFFVMELVNGLPLTKFCDEARLTPKDRLALFVPICQAVQHAHQKGIIHRDLKPGNILVTLIDAKPVPKVIDFGVAKATAGKITEQTMATGFGNVVGTLEYMSPEQAGYSSDDVDTRADIYSLGVILYELLTGLRPIDARRLRKAALHEMFRIIQEEEPPRPSTRLSTDEGLPSLAALRQTDPRKLTASLRGELDWVVMKCLEKQRDRRYDTANALLRDIQRYLADEVVEARPPSAAYRLRKVLQRNKGPAIAAALVLLTLIVGIAGTTAALFEAKRQEGIALDEAAEKEIARSAEESERKRAVAAEALTRAKAEELKHSLGVSNQNLTVVALDNNDVALAGERLDLVSEEQRGWAWHYLRKQTTGGIMTLNKGPRDVIYSAAYSPDGTQIATSHRTMVKLWDARTGKLVRQLSDDQTDSKRSPIIYGTITVSYSPDGNRILYGGGSGKPAVFDTRTGEVVLSLNEPDCERVVFSPDGTRILTVDDGGALKVWENGEILLTAENLKVTDDNENMRTCHFSPDGKRIIVTDGPNLEVWDAEKATSLAEWKLKWDFPQCAASSPDGKKIIVGFSNANAQVLDIENGTTLSTLKHREVKVENTSTLASLRGIIGAAYSPDGTRIVTVGGNGTTGQVNVWDAESGEKLLELPGHQALVHSVAFSPDGQRIVTGSADSTARIWDPRTGIPWTEFKGNMNGYAVNDLSFSPDGSQIVTASGQDRLDHIPVDVPLHMKKLGPVSVWVWDARTGKPVLELKGLKGVVQSVEFSPDGSQILTGGWSDQTTKLTSNFNSRQGHGTVWDAQTGKIVSELNRVYDGVYSIGFSPDGKRIATAGVISFIGMLSTQIDVKMWDAPTGKTLFDVMPLPFMGTFLPGECGGSVAFSPDGTRFVIGGLRGQSEQTFLLNVAPPRVCDSSTGELLFELEGKYEAIKSVAFSADGTRIIVCHGVKVGVWDVSSDPPLKRLDLQGHTGDVNNAAFSPDGKEIATASSDGTVRVWDARTGTTLVELQGHMGEVRSVAFSPDGKRLAAGGVGEGNPSVHTMVWDASSVEQPQ